MVNDETDELSDTGGKKTINRRRLLKISGMGLAATSLPVAVSRRSNASGAGSVDTSDPDSLKRFATKAMTANSKKEAKNLWEGLSRRQAEAVENYINEHSTTDVSVKSDTGLEEVQYNGKTISVEQVDSLEATPETANNTPVSNTSSQKVTPQTYLNTISMSTTRKLYGSINLYTMTHTVGWGRNSLRVYITSNSTSGHGRQHYWYDSGQAFMNEFDHQNFAATYAGREYKHDQPGICDAFRAKVNIRVNRNGSASLISRDPNYDKHSC